MNCGILTNRKWNYGHVSVLPLTFAICSLTLAEVGHTFFLSEIMFIYSFFIILYLILLYIYFIFFYYFF